MGVGPVALTFLFRLPISCTVIGMCTHCLPSIGLRASDQSNLLGRASSTSTDVEIVKGLNEEQCPQLIILLLSSYFFKYQNRSLLLWIKMCQTIQRGCRSCVCVCVCVLVQSPGLLPRQGRSSLLSAGGVVPGRQRPPDETPETTGQSTINMILL